jgi:hypothetical protein
MIKVICINKNDVNNPIFPYSLTVGKVYYVEVVHYSGMRYKLINDRGLYANYNSNLFMSLKEYRKKKLLRLNEKIYE